MFEVVTHGASVRAEKSMEQSGADRRTEDVDRNRQPRAQSSASSRPSNGRDRPMSGRVRPEEVLLLWRALSSYRAGRDPACAPQPGRRNPCPLTSTCPRWDGPDDFEASLNEDFDESERRRAKWPCSRLLDLLGPDTVRIG